MKKEKTLFVMATPNASVIEINQFGQFIAGEGQQRRFVGKRFNQTLEQWEIIPEGVFVVYHPEYIKHLKDKSLLPANQETALAAGVSFQSLFQK